MKYIRVCPKCKSPDVDRDTSTHIQGALGLPSMYVCSTCGYSGYAFPEVPKEEFEDFQQDVDKKKLRDTTKKKSPQVDTNYGKVIVRVVWKYLSIATLIIGLGNIYFFGSSYGLWYIIVNLIFAASGAVMFYITYFKKR